MRAVLAAVALLTAIASADAQEWSTSTEDDIFSGKQTATMIGGSNRNEAVYLQCGSDGDITLSLIFRTEGEKPVGIRSRVLVKVDDGETATLDAESYSHNVDYGGFVTEAGDEIDAIVDAIGAAKSRILFGLEVPDTDFRHSFTVGSRGSTRAAANLKEACAR